MANTLSASVEMRRSSGRPRALLAQSLQYLFENCLALGQEITEVLALGVRHLHPQVGELVIEDRPQDLSLFGVEVYLHAARLTH